MIVLFEVQYTGASRDKSNVLFLPRTTGEKVDKRILDAYVLVVAFFFFFFFATRTFFNWLRLIW